MKIVVTGAIGHIGSYLIRDLAIQFPGAEIVMIDNMMTQRFPSLFNLPTLGHYRFIEGDVTRIDLQPILKDAQVLIHLAAITDAAGSFDKADLLEANNYQSTVKVAEACAQSGTRLIALSSTSVYGTQNEVVAEDCSPDELQPQSPYAITKLKEEQLVTKLCLEDGLKAISCRFGTIFGASPGMRFHTAVNKFCWQAVMKQPITVWSTAYDQKRPYLDLFDASRAISHIIRNDLFDGRIYNVLTHNSTVRDVVDTIREFVPSLEVEFVDNKIMNQLSYEVLCERFSVTGFVSAGSLKRGIGETISLLQNANQQTLSQY
jgi:UDP-glucose 4-epimerase